MVTCTLRDQDYNGNCTGCNNREYCMLSEIMTKLHTLEATVAEMQSKPNSK